MDRLRQPQEKDQGTQNHEMVTDVENQNTSLDSGVSLDVETASSRAVFSAADCHWSPSLWSAGIILKFPLRSLTTTVTEDHSLLNCGSCQTLPLENIKTKPRIVFEWILLILWDSHTMYFEHNYPNSSPLPTFLWTRAEHRLEEQQWTGSVGHNSTLPCYWHRDGWEGRVQEITTEGATRSIMAPTAFLPSISCQRDLCGTQLTKESTQLLL